MLPSSSPERLVRTQDYERKTRTLGTRVLIHKLNLKSDLHRGLVGNVFRLGGQLSQNLTNLSSTALEV